MAGANPSEKKRKRNSDAHAVNGSSINQAARKKRKQVVDSDEDDDSVRQPSSLPVPSSSRQYAKRTAKPTGLVASSFLAKRRGIPEEIDLDSDDDHLPSLASILSASQRPTPMTLQPSQSRANSSTQPERRRHARRSTVVNPSDKGKGTDKTPYRRPRGPLVNLGAFELDEDGNDVEELARKRAARKRRREESRRRKDDSDNSIIECSSPITQSQPRTQSRSSHNPAAKPGASQAPELIVLDSDEGEAAPAVTQTPTAKKRRRLSPKRVVQSGTPSPRPRSSSPPKECSPSRLASPIPPPEQSISDLDQSFEILSRPPSPKGKHPERENEANNETLTYEPGQLQGIYDDRFQQMKRRTQNLATIVPRKKTKGFPHASSMDPGLLSPTYTQDLSKVTATVTSSIWSRSIRNWASSSSRTTLDEIISQGETNKEAAPPSASAAEVEDLLLDSLSDRGDEKSGGDFSHSRNDDFLAAESPAESKDIEEENSDVTVAPDVPLPTAVDEAVPISDHPPSENTSVGLGDTSSTTPLAPSPPAISADGGQDKPPSVHSFSRAREPFPSPPSSSFDHPTPRDRLPQYDKDDAIVTQLLNAAVERYKVATEREALIKAALVELCAALKAEHAQEAESSPAMSSRQSSATLASQSEDTESSSPGPVTPVQSALADPLAGLVGVSSKHAPNIDSLIDDDSLSMDGSQLELGYPD